MKVIVHHSMMIVRMFIIPFHHNQLLQIATAQCQVVQVLQPGRAEKRSRTRGGLDALGATAS